MSKSRFTLWVSLVCMSALAACTSTEGDQAGNTELNVIVPNNESSPGVPATIDIRTVEYTINCEGNDDTFLDNGASFDDAVNINGNLEVVDGRTTGSPPVPTEIWQGFMDLPPGPCSVQLRARDNDGEVICTSPVSPFNIAADSTTKVNLVLVCDVSFQAPVGMLDLDATFSFVVGNFCPDLFVLNVTDSTPEEQVVPTPLGPLPIALTTLEVRARDGDDTCGQSCDPQTCVPSATGLACTPGPDPGVSTTISCTSNPGAGENETALLDCEGDFLPDASCTLAGDQLGTLFPVTGLCASSGAVCTSDADCGTNGPCAMNPEVNLSALVGCVPPTGIGALLPPGTPGATVTCTAVTTDGDLDCNKTKTVTYACPGLSPCDTLGGGIGTCDETDCPACDDGNDCTANTCSGAAVCGNAPLAAGVACTSAPAPAFCDGAGACVSSNCNAQPDPDGSCSDGNECTVNTCNAGGTCDSAPNTGAACSGGTGTCDASGVCIDSCTGVDCSDGNDCTQDLCDSGAGGTCSNPNEADGTPCSGGAGSCSGGTCVVLTPFSFGQATNAIDMCCNNNALPQQSIIPITLDSCIGGCSGNVGGTFSATHGGLLTFPESFLDVAQTVVTGGVQQADLIDAQVTVQTRAGVSGPDLVIPAVFPAGACLITGTACDVANNQPLPGGGNSDCTPVGTFNPCRRLVTVPTSSDAATCASLDVPPDNVKTAQFNLNGFCVTGPLPIPLDPQTGSYTAGASGESMLFGWADTGVPGSTVSGGVVTIGAPNFSNPTGPNGLKVNASGLAVGIECIMAVETGDPLTDPVTCGTTPDAALDVGYLLP